MTNSNNKKMLKINNTTIYFHYIDAISDKYPNKVGISPQEGVTHEVYAGDNDVFVGFTSDTETLECKTWNGWSITISLTTGDILSRVFTK